jgi:hypothetical protein
MEQLSGITVDRNYNGVPIFAHIDLRKHSEFMPLLKKKGVQINSEINWSEKMKRALSEPEFKMGDANNFWNE